jgi:glycerol-3-phosphate acyltransferase PlsY
LVFLAIVAGFLAGSIPFGSIIGRVFFGVDLRKHGSGNIGAANAMRTIGKGGAAAVLLLDALKGYLPVAIATMLAKHAGLPPATVLTLGLLAATGAILGHCFTPWLGFRGGKGVATSLGAVLGLSWQAALAGVVVYALVARLTKISAIGSLSGVAVGAAMLGYLFGTLGAVYGAFSVALILYTHRSNLARLRAGKELTLTSSSEVP